MERITISSSLKYKETIRTAITVLQQQGIVGRFPNLDGTVKKEEVDLEFMKRLEREHFDSIDDTEALYVICPNGYVGTLVSVEIGYARAKGKPVIFSETPEDLGVQAMANGYVGLTELERIKDFGKE
jgi:nucleoside 2-deoxyribosyltransferase